MVKLKQYKSYSNEKFFIGMKVGEKFNYSPYSLFWGDIVEAAQKSGTSIEKCGIGSGIVVSKYNTKKEYPAIIEKEVIIPDHLKKHKNYLKNLRPDIYKQLHPTKNKNVDIEELAVSSDKRVWWLCVNGHEWSTAVLSRTTAGKGNCPHCWRDREISGNNFLKSHPILSEYWDRENNGDYRPETCTVRDGIRIHFKCDKGHQFSRKLYNNLPDGCPKCKIQTNYSSRSLSKEDAMLVKKLYREGHKKIDIAREMGINYTTIKNIISGTTYKDIE
ncbi:zinc-ribbon domain-containing protein [Paenibacillus sp. QZ-Y1]|uniref:zinc-ribbon domain-containing protein n=1 Tax=Paenibacillus sp. QZ-Y1 TaxID=3414511 RepID=UPI003F7A68CA